MFESRKVIIYDAIPSVEDGSAAHNPCQPYTETET